MLLKKVRCQWASIIEPNTKFEPVYEIEALLDDKQAAELAAIGFKIKTQEDGTPSYRFKCRTHGSKKNGEKYDKAKPRCVDASREPFEELIGNGSLVNIQYEVKKGTFAGTPYCRGELQAVQVLEHVPFGGDDEFEEAGETIKIDPAGETMDDDDVPF